ncbi:MAG: DUF2752 domain-containing protein [Myxococcota bacterium]
MKWLGTRSAGLLLALPTWTVLGISRALHPDPAGTGTHTQLGLGRCPVLALTGYPCPMCGMTTTFALMADLRPVDAALNQPFGLVLFSLTVVAALSGAAQLLTGRPVVASLLERVLRREQLFAGLLLAGMIGGWVYKTAIVRGW